MKIFFTVIFLSILSSSTKAQRFFATTFDNLPQSYQLYPRNSSNEAFVPISGNITAIGWDAFSVQIFRNKQFIGYQKAIITYKNSIGTFAFQPIKIKAELAEYDFKVYAIKGSDSLSLVNREKIVAGDVYVLSGQSNSTCFFKDTRINEFCRTFGVVTGTFNTENYNPADTLWAFANQDYYSQETGDMGFEFQKTLVEKYGIPICLINGGFNFSSMKQHATRTESNPADLTNGYGRMIYRLQKARIASAVKGFIFRQGETEAYGEGINWDSYFDIYYQNLKKDLPSIKKIYLYQIDIIYYPSLQGAIIRNNQRLMPDKYADVQTLASVGTIGFDGIHYSPEGYHQNGREIALLAGKDFYNSTDVDNINAPNIRKAYYSAKDKSEITLQFDEGQDLFWNNQDRNLLMKNQFFFDNDQYAVQSGTASGNKVILKINNAKSYSKITYLPPYILATSPDNPYTGPYIKNKRGLRALSFYEVNITPFVENLAVSFSKIPQNLQLFPRNTNDEATVTFIGTVQSPDYTSVSLIASRNNTVTKVYKSNLIYTNGRAHFSFNAVIKAELAEYGFKIYVAKGLDSVLVTSRENIVAGDVFAINGQSNAASWGVSNTFPNYNYRNEYCRTFGQSQNFTSVNSKGDTTWAYSNVGSPYVGVWGIELQKSITEKYGIPTCILNEALPGSNITEHARDDKNPQNLNTYYGRLLYRATKAGILNSIKGFFFWQGESEEYRNPANWKVEFDKLYNNWKVDYPSVGKFYIFQINLLKAPLPEMGEMRDFQRQIKNIYPKTEVIATVGNPFYDGLHYTVDGYKRTANEVFRLVSRDFYGSADTLQITSPNVKNIYYTNSAKDEIALVFDNNHQVVWTSDSTYTQDNGTLRKYFLKDYIYLNNANDKILSGRAENNKIILKTSGYTNTQTLTYLPPYYPLNSALEGRGVFGGPYLKNQRGISALSFYKQTISDPITPTVLSAKIQTIASVQLSWKEVLNCVYQLEIKDLQTDKYTVLKLLQKGTLNYLVENLLVNSTYTFRIKVITPDNLESEYSSVQIQTPKALEAVLVQSESTFFDAIKLTWKPVTDAVSYVIERKNLTTNNFDQIAKLGSNILVFEDKSLNDNTLYEYRIKAVGTFLESAYATISQKTIAKLSNPELALTVIYYNSLKLDWKPILNATSYILERKAPNQDFKVWGTYESAVLSFTDKDLDPNTAYVYRMKAYGNKTESAYTLIDGRTPAKLTTPEIVTIVSTYQSLKILWKSVQNVTQYVLERKLSESDSYKELAKLDASKTEYLDENLKDKTSYFYRLKALGSRTESDFVTVKDQTQTILANQQEIMEEMILFPNPTHSKVTLKFTKPTTGTLNIIDLLGRELYQENIIKISEKEISLTNFQKGSYLLILSSSEGTLSKKLMIE